MESFSRIFHNLRVVRTSPFVPKTTESAPVRTLDAESKSTQVSGHSTFIGGLTRTELGQTCDDLLARVTQAAMDARYEEIIAAVGELDHLIGEKILRVKSLYQARLIRAEAFFFAGCPEDASNALAALDDQYGRTYESAMQRARLALFSGAYVEGVQALDEAIFLLPAKRSNERLLRRTALLKVELLTASQQRQRARDYFFSVFPTRNPQLPLTNQEMAALRKTVNDDESLMIVRDALTSSLSFYGRRALNALFQYSIAARDLGKYQEALLAIQRRFILGTRVLKIGSKRSSPSGDWSDSARRALLQLREDLEAAGIDFFLISGTLLGCVREGRILGHDKDIDVGVMSHVSPVDIRSALGKTGRFLILPEVTSRLQRVKHCSGVMIDVFIHWEEEGRVWHEGQKSRWWNTPFSLREVDFLGERFRAPENASLYLQENYGKWQVPVADFETFCDTPNMVITDRNQMLWYYNRALLDHFHAGRPQQFAKVWSQLKKLSRPSIEFRMAVEAAQAKMSKISTQDASS